jgi:MoaA/NifB/PqqE/SkfB family radical SAM enzyme
MSFPKFISFTVTNRCNLRCKMCGQWSENGYVQNREGKPSPELALIDWKRLVDECADHGVGSVLIRGGEPFLFPGIIELLEYIHGKGMFVSIDSNGTVLLKYAADLVRIGQIHVTVSVDGPEAIHDQVRGVAGTFEKIREGLKALSEAEQAADSKISKSICFTISPYSLPGLGDMPDVARSLGVGTVVIVPYNYIPESVGKTYEKELRELFGLSAFSWSGFRHEGSGVDFGAFLRGLRKYKSSLQGLEDYPYLPLTEDEYRDWFKDSVTPVGPTPCSNVEKLIDIQPDGEVNCCVDTPDYSFGNVMDSSIEELWNGEKTEQFREYRRKNRLSSCYRCVSKYMAQFS